ncbi:MAG: AAA family ATPase [Candidatus Levybacteria bacterium]|nr:AAA family ATPase [Candidatus Levybacteria bacterium]
MEPLLFSEHTLTGLPFSIYDKTLLKFGRINYLFGPNGSGKTLTLKNIIQKAKNTISGSSRSKEEYFAQYIPAVPLQYQDSYQFIDLAYQREQGGELDPSVFYQHLSDHPEIMIRIRDSIQRYLGRHLSLTKRGVQNVMTFFRENDEMDPYSPAAESDGLRRLSLLLTYVYHPKCLILAIDEPELHLHPDMVSFLLEEMESEIQYGKQYFFATHSPEIIRIGSFDKYAYFYFDLKDKLRESKLLDLNQIGAQALMSDLGFLLDVNRRAFLFAPITLFVEGIGDEVVYSNIHSRNLVDWSRRIFMVNVGGCTNVIRFVKLWKLLNKPYRVILDNINRKTKEDKDAITNTINTLCEVFLIKSTEIEDKIKELEKFNIFIAPYSDVCQVKKKHTQEMINISIENAEIAWDQFDFTDQIETLKKAIKTDENLEVRIRDIEQEWLKNILAEVSKIFANSDNVNQTLESIKKDLENRYPRLSIAINPNANSYLEGKYKISSARFLVFNFSKDSAKHSFKSTGRE